MPGEASPTAISKLIDEGILAINDGYRAKNSELGGTGLPFARAQNINNGFHFDGADCFPLEDLHKVGVKISEPGDVVFTSKGTVGRSAYVGPETPRFVYAPQLCFWRVLDSGRLYPRWLYYWMHSREFFVQFSGVAGQTDMAEYVSLRDQRRMHITIPPLEEQQAIACILGSLDDKIELNRRMNRTLEEMARAIFKSWFVDFLPVRAKMAAKAQDPSLLLPQAKQGTWYVYAIECNDGSLYVGQTEDLRQRWLQHIGGKGSDWTKRHPPVRVPYWEKQPSREAAVEREHWLKTGFGRKWLKKEIAARTQTGDPVRAKAAVRGDHPTWTDEQVSRAACPSLKPEIAALFPDCFEQSDLGEIPKGWRVGILGDVVAELVSGGRPKGGAVKEGVPSVGAENIIGLGKYDFSKEKYVPLEFFKELQRKGSAVQDGDVLLYKDGAQIGRKTYFDCGFPHAECAVNEHVLILRAKNQSYQRYLYFWLDQDWMTQEIISLNSNSAQPGINQQGVRTLKLLKAPEAVVEAYDHIVESLIDRLFAACHESRTLAALRDALLPKLISGELRVPDAERFLKERGL